MNNSMAIEPRRALWHAQPRLNKCGRHSATTAEQTVANAMIASQCIASDDPRLKEH